MINYFAAPDPNSNEQIQIMTIHKSKGLEFDMVILPSLHRGGKSNDPELLMWQERISRSGHPELLMGPIPPSHIENKQDAIYTHLREEQKNEKPSRLVDWLRSLYSRKKTITPSWFYQARQKRFAAVQPAIKIEFAIKYMECHRTKR